MAPRWRFYITGVDLHLTAGCHVCKQGCCDCAQQYGVDLSG